LLLNEVSLFEDAFTEDEMTASAVRVLENLKPGTWQFYEHPGMIIEGKEVHWHIGTEWDAAYRNTVSEALISKQMQMY